MAFVNLLNSHNFNFFTFAALITDEEEAIEAAYDVGLIPPGTRSCPRCGFAMTQRPLRSMKSGFIWRCSKRPCRDLTINPLQNTFFEDVKLPFVKIFRLLICFIFKMPVTSTALHCEVCQGTAVDFFSFCREICRVTHTHDAPRIGGQGDVVEVDETHLFTTKYYRGGY